jgi:hypothetical protein
VKLPLAIWLLKDSAVIPKSVSNEESPFHNLLIPDNSGFLPACARVGMAFDTLVTVDFQR